MNNIPKFRIWHKQYKMMFEVAGIYWWKDTYTITCNGVDGDFEFDEKEIILMQASPFRCTKTPKEIYEHDIIKVYPLHPDFEPEIFLLDSLMTLYADVGKGIIIPVNCEILGNKWEHPELLEKSDEN